MGRPLVDPTELIDPYVTRESGSAACSRVT